MIAASVEAGLLKRIRVLKKSLLTVCDVMGQSGDDTDREMSRNVLGYV